MPAGPASGVTTAFALKGPGTDCVAGAKSSITLWSYEGGRKMVTKEEFDTYKKVQRSGRYNMLLDSKRARRATGLSQ